MSAPERDSDPAGQDGKRKHVRVEQGTSPIEWIAAAVGAAVLTVLVLYMATIGFKEGDGTPVIVVTGETPVRQGDAWLVRFSARNSGPATATDLVLRARLTEAGRELESVEIVIDYLPSSSERSGAFLFRHDPSRGQIEFLPAAYQDP